MIMKHTLPVSGQRWTQISAVGSLGMFLVCITMTGFVLSRRAVIESPHCNDVEVAAGHSERPCQVLPHQVIAPEPSSQLASHQVLLDQLILPQRAKASWNAYYDDVTRFIADALSLANVNSTLSVVEVGTAYGGNAASIAKRFSRATVVAVDPLLSGYDAKDLHSKNLEKWETERSMSRDEFSLVWAQALAADGMASSGCRYHMMHTTSLMGAAVLSTFDMHFDVAFIDGLHTYEGVTKDIAAYTPLMKPGALMIFNDYGARSFPGVTRAVDAFATANGLKLIIGARDVPPGPGNAAAFLP